MSRWGGERSEASCRAATAVSGCSKHAHQGSEALLSGHRAQGMLPPHCPTASSTHEQAGGLSTCRHPRKPSAWA